MKEILNKYWYQQDSKTKIGIGLGIFVTFSYCSYKYLVNKPEIYTYKLPIETFIDNEIWTRDYPFYLRGCYFYARCSIIKLSNGKYLIHSPSPIDDTLIDFVKDKEIEYIVAPGNYHYLYVAEWKKQYPNAKVLISPGVELKAYNLVSDVIYGILHNNYIDNDINSVLNKDFDFVLIRGFSEMNEVSMIHKRTKTLILVDAMEYVTPKYYHMNRLNHIFWHMLECIIKHYRLHHISCLHKHLNLIKQSFESILKWEFTKIIINHGQNIYPEKKGEWMMNKLLLNAKQFVNVLATVFMIWCKENVADTKNNELNSMPRLIM